MEHILDIGTDLFEKIKNHETLNMRIPFKVNGILVRDGDDLKLYHPGNPKEALRVHITKISPVTCEKKDFLPVAEEENSRWKIEEGSNGESDKVNIEFELLEWMFRMETELDDLLREEQKMWEDLL